MSEALVPDRDAQEGAPEEPSPSLRQRLHAATGDRDAEAEALAAEAGDVSVEDAKIAVQLARGERSAEAPELVHDIATPADAEAVKELRHEDAAGEAAEEGGERS